MSPAATKSPREVAQDALVLYLTVHGDRWDAPYGVIPNLRRLPRGAVRTVTFGVARLLDATATVWAPDRIVVTGQGPLASAVAGEYGSVGEVIERLAAVHQPPVPEPDDE